MKRKLPFALTTLRLLLGPVVLACAWAGVSHWIFLPLLLTGTLSDIFDGILARKFGVATPALRRFDSMTDVIYYLFVFGATWILCRGVMERSWPWLAVILISEAVIIAASYLKFRKYPATHSYLAKLFGLCLLGGLIALLVFNASDWVVKSLAAVALAANSEIIVIHLLMGKAPVDVRSVFALPDR